MQPGEQVHVVTQAAAELLRGMHMGVDKTGHDDLTVAIDHFVIFGNRRHPAVYALNTVSVDDKASVRVNAFVRVHGYNIGIFQQRAHEENPPTTIFTNNISKL